ncbi:MAG: MBL fold metallo-hydrolase, partial [Planctomycetota bacterium]
TGCKTIICENNCRDEDAELARRSYPTTSSDVGRLAAGVQPETLVLFHVSDQYTETEWREQLDQVREQFGFVEFPPQWPQLK